MKKYLFFSILSLILLLPLPASAIKRLHVNPINIASRLVMQQDSSQVAATLEYYGYTPSPSDSHGNLKEDTLTPDNFSVFSHPDGSIIRFAYLDHSDKYNYPTLQVYTKQSRPEIEKKLQELDYKKVGNHYENILSKYSKYLTKCTFGPGKFLTFDRKKKQ